ncbi:PepSY domain-containing protein [Streptomyces sp. NPDC058637]|uniref:PepSY domain-containing protein n=1 Tax=Streptomyces sp. NPDC058637 TaxID=3346569 RepID=UPI00365B3ADE
MKRNIAIAAVTAAVLVGGGAAATVAFADDDSTSRTTGTTGTETETAGGGRDDDGKESVRGAGGTISLDRAVAAALKTVPGTVTEAELDDDDDDRAVWELNVYGSDRTWHDVKVDARTAKVVSDRDDDNDDRDRNAPRSAAVTMDAAARAALQSVPGGVTSIDLDDDRGDDDDDRRGGVLRWDVEVAGKDGARHELHVDAKNGEVSVDDDRSGDRDDDEGDRDDRGDDDHDDN